MLTGSVPFDAESLPGVMQHHFFTPPPDINSMRSGIPAELAAVIRRALAKKPEDRYASTREMVDALDAVPLNAEQRRSGEESLRTLARGGTLPRIAATAAPTLAQVAPLSDARLSGLFRAARARMGARAKVVGLTVAAALAVLLLVAAIAVSGYYGPGGATRRAVRLYEHGRREAAQAIFARLANDYPQRPVPRIYLGRIARETRQYATAKRELEAAIQLDPASAPAMREMASLMFVTGRFDMAERFYRRALERDPSDHLARGYLGCSLLRLGRTAEAQTALTTAGSGPWSSCR
jgi:tetratricopeptide (TPR) repeat protein